MPRTTYHSGRVTGIVSVAAWGVEGVWVGLGLLGGRVNFGRRQAIEAPFDLADGLDELEDNGGEPVETFFDTLEVGAARTVQVDSDRHHRCHHDCIMPPSVPRVAASMVRLLHCSLHRGIAWCRYQLPNLLIEWVQ